MARKSKLAMYLGLFALAIVLGTSFEMKGQGIEDGPGGPGGEGYGGLCCQTNDFACDHPIGSRFLNAKWVDGRSFCP